VHAEFLFHSVPLQIPLEIIYHHLVLQVASRHKEENEWMVSKLRQNRARKENRITRKRKRNEKSRDKKRREKRCRKFQITDRAY